MTRSEESQGGERQMDDVKQMDVVQEEQRHNAPLGDDGPERDMRAVLGLDDPQDEAQDEPENEEQETTDEKDGETPKDAGSEDPHPRSEEHTSELQSRENLVCRLLLEKKNQKR